MRDHTKLKVFQLADRLALLIYRATRDFPSTEKYGLTAQLRRAAFSVAANIVEGAARRTESEFARFLLIAYGSSRELEYGLSIALRLDYLTQSAAAEAEDVVSQTSRALRALIVAIQKSQRSVRLASC